MTPLWKHTKTKTLYQIVCFSIDEASLVPMVVYRQFSGDASAVWNRPCAEFFDGRFRQVIEDPEAEEDLMMNTLHGPVPRPNIKR